MTVFGVGTRYGSKPLRPAYDAPQPRLSRLAAVPRAPRTATGITVREGRMAGLQPCTARSPAPPPPRSAVTADRCVLAQCCSYILVLCRVRCSRPRISRSLDSCVSRSLDYSSLPKRGSLDSCEMCVMTREIAESGDRCRDTTTPNTRAERIEFEGGRRYKPDLPDQTQPLVPLAPSDAVKSSAP